MRSCYQFDQWELTDYSRFAPIHHDSAYGASFTSRGNVTKITSPGSVRNFHYDIAGNVVSADDNNGHSISSAFSTATQMFAPGETYDWYRSEYGDKSIADVFAEDQGTVGATQVNGHDVYVRGSFFSGMDEDYLTANLMREVFYNLGMFDGDIAADLGISKETYDRWGSEIISRKLYDDCGSLFQ